MSRSTKPNERGSEAMHVNKDTGEIVEVEPVVRPFSDWLREQAKGKSHEELSEALRDLTLRVGETGKKGVLVYAVTVEQMKDGKALIVRDQIKLKLPEFDRDASLFWPDADGNLRRTDPNQLSFESLREVPSDDIDIDNLKDAK